MNSNLMEEAEKLSVLKEKKNQIEEELKEIKAQITEQEKKVIERMTEEELQNFKGKNGVTYSIRTTIIPNVLAENKPLLIQKLKENGYESIVKEEVNSKTFQAFVKEQGWETEEELPDYLQEVVTLFEKVSVGTRKG